MSVTAERLAGTLYIVPTPIGNLRDITLRAIDVLREVDLIAAEDTRHSGSLMQHLNIATPLISVHEHNEAQRAQVIIGKLSAGQNVALVSDAGTPLISDPGFTLVNECRKAGVKVVALPGASAVITALSGAGLPTDKFLFLGFLPVKQQAKKALISSLMDNNGTTVFYEAPRRVLDTLTTMDELFGNTRVVAIVKELTKAFETYQIGSAASCMRWLTDDPLRQKGEFVLLVGPAQQKNQEIPQEAVSLLTRLMAEIPLKKAAAIVSEHYGLKKNTLYQLGLTLK